MSSCSRPLMLFMALASVNLPSSLATPLFQGATRAAAVSVSIPLSAPSSANTLARSLVSISIEGDRWPEWAGTSSANTFFKNTLTNLGAITGRMPEVRVGANSEDHTTLDESVNVVQTTFPASTSTTPYPEALTVRVSSEYYELSKYLPSGTHMTWGVNLGSADVSNAVAETKAIVKAFAAGGAVANAGVLLDYIEIGNEPDLYRNNGLRSSSYDVNQYASQWQTFATAVASAAGMQQGQTPSLLLASFANSNHGGGGFSPQKLYSQGILSGPLGKYINTVSQHHYSGSFCQGSGGLLQDLMAKSGVRSNISQFNSDISASYSNGLVYVFGETNSYACHGAPGVSNTAGAAIWTLDYALQAATKNVRRVYFHDGIGFKYNLIQPVTLYHSTLDNHNLSPPLAPHVQPQYYAAIVAAHFISSSRSNTVATRISELSIGNSYVAGYAAYDNDRLARIVFINSKAYFKSTTTARGSVHLETTISGSGAPTKMRVRRLKIGYADDGSGVTYAGQSYENSGNGLVSGTEVYEDVDVSSGVTISDTEAVLLVFS